MRLVLMLFALCLAAPAFAALPPQYYEQARRDAADVIVIEVSEVGAPPVAGYGNCAVRGQVVGVLRGDTYQQGGSVTVNVPCANQGARVPIGGVLYQTFETLRTFPYGRAYLQADGQLALSQYEPLNEWTEELPAP